MEQDRNTRNTERTGMKIIDILRDDIAANRIVSDGKLPSMRDVSSRYKCGTTTVKRAFDLLEQEGAEAVMPDLLDFFLYSAYNSNFKYEKLFEAKR